MIDWFRQFEGNVFLPQRGVYMSPADAPGGAEALGDDVDSAPDSLIDFDSAKDTLLAGFNALKDSVDDAGLRENVDRIVTELNADWEEVTDSAEESADAVRQDLLERYTEFLGPGGLLDETGTPHSDTLSDEAVRDIYLTDAERREMAEARMTTLQGRLDALQIPTRESDMDANTYAGNLQTFLVSVRGEYATFVSGLGAGGINSLEQSERTEVYTAFREKTLPLVSAVNDTEILDTENGIILLRDYSTFSTEIGQLDISSRERRANMDQLNGRIRDVSGVRETEITMEDNPVLFLLSKIFNIQFFADRATGAIVGWGGGKEEQDHAIATIASSLNAQKEWNDAMREQNFPGDIRGEMNIIMHHPRCFPSPSLGSSFGEQMAANMTARLSFIQEVGRIKTHENSDRVHDALVYLRRYPLQVTAEGAGPGKLLISQFDEYIDEPRSYPGYRAAPSTNPDEPQGNVDNADARPTGPGDRILSDDILTQLEAYRNGEETLTSRYLLSVMEGMNVVREHWESLRNFRPQTVYQARMKSALLQARNYYFHQNRDVPWSNDDFQDGDYDRWLALQLYVMPEWGDLDVSDPMPAAHLLELQKSLDSHVEALLDSSDTPLDEGHFDALNGTLNEYAGRDIFNHFTPYTPEDFSDLPDSDTDLPDDTPTPAIDTEALSAEQLAEDLGLAGAFFDHLPTAAVMEETINTNEFDERFQTEMWYGNMHHYMDLAGLRMTLPDDTDIQVGRIVQAIYRASQWINEDGAESIHEVNGVSFEIVDVSKDSVGETFDLSALRDAEIPAELQGKYEYMMNTFNTHELALYEAVVGSIREASPQAALPLTEVRSMIDSDGQLDADGNPVLFTQNDTVQIRKNDDGAWRLHFDGAEYDINDAVVSYIENDVTPKHEYSAAGHSAEEVRQLDQSFYEGLGITAEDWYRLNAYEDMVQQNGSHDMFYRMLFSTVDAIHRGDELNNLDNGFRNRNDVAIGYIDNNEISPANSYPTIDFSVIQRIAPHLYPTMEISTVGTNVVNPIQSGIPILPQLRGILLRNQ